METKRDELLEHDYDGIREFDNPLPRWWLGLFYGTILFALIFTPYYLLGFGPSEAQEYQQDMAAASAPVAPEATPTASAPGGGSPPGTAPAEPPAAGRPAAAVVGNAQAIAAGAQVFAANCVPCHGAQGQGGIGPNLTDKFWLHGNRYENIVHTITFGVQDKGMIAWKATLSPDKIENVAAFVLSLKGTQPPHPKAPQGTPYPD